MDFCDWTSEFHRLAQHRETLGRRAGDVPWERAELIQSLSLEVDKNAKNIVASLSLTANLAPAENLLQHLTPADIVLSTNFDTVLERAATKASRCVSLGLPPERKGPLVVCRFDPGAIRLLKLHGSVDWYLAERHSIEAPSSPSVQLLYRKIDDNLEGSDAGQDSDEHEYRHCLTRCSDMDAARALERDYFPEHRAAMPRFGGAKKPHQLPGLGLLWAAAADAIREATALICVGFSFSDQDQMVRLLVATSLNARTALPAVTLVDPSSDDIARRIPHLFPNPVLVVRRHEKLDWTSVLPTSLPPKLSNQP